MLVSAIACRFFGAIWFMVRVFDSMYVSSVAAAASCHLCCVIFLQGAWGRHCPRQQRRPRMRHQLRAAKGHVEACRRACICDLHIGACMRLCWLVYLFSVGVAVGAFCCVWSLFSPHALAFAGGDSSSSSSTGSSSTGPARPARANAKRGCISNGSLFAPLNVYAHSRVCVLWSCGCA